MMSPDKHILLRSSQERVDRGQRRNTTDPNSTPVTLKSIGVRSMSSFCSRAEHIPVSATSVSVVTVKGTRKFYNKI